VDEHYEIETSIYNNGNLSSDEEVDENLVGGFFSLNSNKNTEYNTNNQQTQLIDDNTNDNLFDNEIETQDIDNSSQFNLSDDEEVDENRITNDKLQISSELSNLSDDEMVDSCEILPTTNKISEHYISKIESGPMADPKRVYYSLGLDEIEFQTILSRIKKIKDPKTKIETPFLFGNKYRDSIQSSITIKKGSIIEINATISKIQKSNRG
jgi:hypothetical protein